MNLEYEIMRKRPLAFWTLSESTGNSIDKSGFGRTLSHFNTPSRTRPGLYLQGISMLYSGTQYSRATFGSILVGGREHIPFSIEVLVRPSGPVTARRLLVGTPTAGLFITPTGFEMYVETSVGTYTAKYTIGEFVRVYHVVVNYTEKQFTIIVNGEQGDSIGIEGTFINTSTDFYIGGITTTSATAVFLGPVAVHRSSLEGRDIARHMLAAWDTIPEFWLQQNLGAVAYDLTDNSGVVGTQIIDTHERFYDGTNTEIEVANGTFSIPIDAVEPGVRISPVETLDPLLVIDGSRVDWDGSPTGLTVQSSIDHGVTWQNCTNHETIPGLGEGVNTTGMTLRFRYTFNVQTPAPWLRSLRARVFVSKNPSANMPNWQMTAYEPFHLAEGNNNIIYSDDLSAARLRAPGRLVIPAPDGIQFFTLEMWLRKPESTWTEFVFIFDGRNPADATQGAHYIYQSSATAYTTVNILRCVVNGVERTPVPADFSPYHFTHLVLVFTAAITNPSTIGARHNNTGHMSLDINSVALYGEQLSLARIQQHYRWGRGLTVIRANDTLGRIQENTGKAYKYPWAVEIGAG